MNLGIPLNNFQNTFLIALTKVDFEVTSKTIRKISALVYAKGRSLAYYSCPAVSLNTKLLTIDLD